VLPTTNGNSTTYQSTITDGGSVTDGIQVQFCLTAEENTAWTSFDV